jgi:hypothetical protein
MVCGAIFAAVAAKPARPDMGIAAMTVTRRERNRESVNFTTSYASAASSRSRRSSRLPITTCGTTVSLSVDATNISWAFQQDPPAMIYATEDFGEGPRDAH